MASSMRLIIAILSIVIVSISQNPNSSFVVKADEALIQNLCDKTALPGICKDCLHGDPGSPTANAAGLSRISVSCAYRSATRFANDMLNLLNSATDPKLKPVLSKCLNNNLVVSSTINKTFSFLDKDDYVNARLNVFDALQTVAVCVDLFHKDLPGTPVPDLITVETDVVKQDCVVAMDLLGRVTD